MTIDTIARGLAAQATLLAAPRTARPRVALLGDSRAWNSHSTAAPNTSVNGYGLAFHVLMQSGARVEMPQRLNFGVGGITTGDVNSRSFGYIATNTAPLGTQVYAGCHPQPLAATPSLTPLEAAAQSDAQIVLYLCSTNDRFGGVTLAASQANVGTALARLRQAGKTVILVADMPRGDTVNTARRLSGQQLSWHVRMAQWLRGIRMNGVYVVDPWPVLAAAASTTGDALVGAMYDGLHPGFPAAYLTGGLIAGVINTLLPPFGGIVPASNTDLWSADNPSGALNANPMLGSIGVTPTATAGVTISGQLPASWQHVCTNMTGMTVAYGTAVQNSVACLSITLSGTPTAASPALLLRNAIGGTAAAAIVAGDAVQAVAQGFVQAGASGLYALSLMQRLYATDNSTILDEQRVGGTGIAGSSMTTVPGAASGAWGGPWISEPYVSGGAAIGSSSQLLWQAYFTQNVPVSATLLIGPTAMRKIV